MKAFELSFSAVLLRFYLMMGIILVSFFIGQPLLAFLAFPVLLSALLGVKIELKPLKFMQFNHFKNERSNTSGISVAA